MCVRSMKSTQARASKKTKELKEVRMWVCLCVCMSVCVCVPRKRFLDRKLKFIVVKLVTETVSVTRMHGVLIILILTFIQDHTDRNHDELIILILTIIQDHTDRNHEHNKCLIISEAIQAMPIKCAVKIVRLKVYMIIASPMTLTFGQGHKCVSNVTTF